MNSTILTEGFRGTSGIVPLNRSRRIQVSWLSSLLVRPQVNYVFKTDVNSSVQCTEERKIKPSHLP